MDEFEEGLDDPDGLDDRISGEDYTPKVDREGFTWEDAAMLGGAMGFAFEEGRMIEKDRQRKRKRSVE